MAKKSISYTPQTLDLIFYAGDGSGIRMMVADSTNVPVPLTGTMLAHVRSTREEVDPPDATFNIDLSQGPQGIVTLYLTAEQTEALMNGVDPGEKYTGVWDLEWTPSGSEPFTICQGKVECSRDVSH